MYLKYTERPKNNAQTLHSEISSWDYIKDAQRFVPVQTIVY